MKPKLSSPPLTVFFCAICLIYIIVCVVMSNDTIILHHIETFLHRNTITYQYGNDGKVLVCKGEDCTLLKVDGFYVYRDPDAIRAQDDATGHYTSGIGYRIQYPDRDVP